MREECTLAAPPRLEGVHSTRTANSKTIEMVAITTGHSSWSYAIRLGDQDHKKISRTDSSWIRREICTAVREIYDYETEYSMLVGWVPAV